MQCTYVYLYVMLVSPEKDQLPFGIEHYFTSWSQSHHITSNVDAEDYNDVHNQRILMTRETTGNWKCASTISMPFQSIWKWDALDCHSNILVDYYLQENSLFEIRSTACNRNTL